MGLGSIDDVIDGVRQSIMSGEIDRDIEAYCAQSDFDPHLDDVHNLALVHITWTDRDGSERGLAASAIRAAHDARMALTGWPGHPMMMNEALPLRQPTAAAHAASAGGDGAAPVISPKPTRRHPSQWENLPLGSTPEDGSTPARTPMGMCTCGAWREPR